MGEYDQTIFHIYEIVKEEKDTQMNNSSGDSTKDNTV